ncbi:MAG: cytosine-specific methyltransferase [Candidatus Saccharibacteria bacterium]|nr:cytosine-specific methyltransferase [Candidatus Saccharibacteria bacterium]
MRGKRPSVIDLFAGVGGLSLGFEAAGFDVVAAVEFDPVHAAAHEFNFPYSKTFCTDMNKLETIELKKALQEKGYDELDMLVGGPPCQGFSTIGKRQLDDPRNKLVFEYLRVVKDLRPKYFLLENVPGMIAGKQIKFVEELVEECEKLGYKIHKQIKVLSAASYGVPQKRRRLIILGSRGDMPELKYPDPTHIEKSDKVVSLFDSTAFVGAKSAIGDLEDIPVNIKNDKGLPNNLTYDHEYRKNYNRHEGSLFNLCHIRQTDGLLWGHVGSVHGQISIDRFIDTEPGTTETTSRFFRLHPDRPCNTLRAGTTSDKGAHTAPRPIHYKLPRCISIREAARLHSFPDWFQFHRTVWHGFRQIGNAVAPMFGKALGDEVIRKLGINPSDLPVYELDKQDAKLLQFNMTDAAAFFSVDRGIIPIRKRLIALDGKKQQIQPDNSIDIPQEVPSGIEAFSLP